MCDYQLESAFDIRMSIIAMNKEGYLLKLYRKSAFLLALIISFTFALVGCGESNTVSRYIISDRQYTEKSDLERADQPEQLTVGKDVYASVYFIESPKGMEYTVKWFVNGNEVKTDKQKMPSDREGMIVFALEGDKVIAGTLKIEISFGGDILASRELVIAGE